MVAGLSNGFGVTVRAGVELGKVLVLFGALSVTNWYSRALPTWISASLLVA